MICTLHNIHIHFGYNLLLNGGSFLRILPICYNIIYTTCGGSPFPRVRACRFVRARKEYKAEKAEGAWNYTTFIKAPRACKSEDEQVVALKSEVNRLKK